MDLLKKRLDIARLIAEELAGTIDERDRAVLTRWLDEMSVTGRNIRIFWNR